MGEPFATDNVSKTTPPVPGPVPVINGDVDVPVDEVQAVGVTLVSTPENATAPHTSPEAPDAKLAPVMIVSVLALKPVICHMANEGTAVFEVMSVTVPPGGLRDMPLVMNEVAFVPETLNRM
jgi:hypothetical protein